jgi:hypothetical protein
MKNLEIKDLKKDYQGRTIIPALAIIDHMGDIMAKLYTVSLKDYEWGKFSTLYGTFTACCKVENPNNNHRKVAMHKYNEFIGRAIKLVDFKVFSIEGGWIIDVFEFGPERYHTAPQLGKYNWVKPEHIETGETMSVQQQEDLDQQDVTALAKPVKITWADPKFQIQANLDRRSELANVTYLPDEFQDIIKRLKSSEDILYSVFRINGSDGTLWGCKYSHEERNITLYYHTGRNHYLWAEGNCWSLYSVEDGKAMPVYPASLKEALFIWALDHTSNQVNLDKIKGEKWCTITKCGNYQWEYSPTGQYKYIANGKVKDRGTFGIDNRLVPVLAVRS